MSNPKFCAGGANAAWDNWIASLHTGTSVSQLVTLLKFDRSKTYEHMYTLEYLNTLEHLDTLEHMDTLEHLEFLEHFDIL